MDTLILSQVISAFFDELFDKKFRGHISDISAKTATLHFSRCIGQVTSVGVDIDNISFG